MPPGAAPLLVVRRNILPQAPSPFAADAVNAQTKNSPGANQT
jgi:hypothetical protein